MRDAGGRITERSETIGGVMTLYAYHYDAAGRLDEVRRNGTVAASYAYDADGNRLALTTPTGTIAGSYDAQDRLASYGTKTYAYTRAGELASQTDTATAETTSYGYDALGNLRSVALPDGRNLAYEIDGESRRVGKRVNGALQKGWLYADALRIVAETDGSGAVTSRFVYGAKPNVPESMIRGGATYRIFSDHLGSPRLVVNASTGAVAQRIDYDAFGSVTQDTSPGFQPFGFAGGLYDADTKLVRFGARDYDAEVGRWTSKDPAGFQGGDPNIFGYTAGDPINFVDLNGLDLMIIEGGPAGTNRLGHTAVAVEGQGVFSWGTRQPLGSSTTEYLGEQSKYRDSEVTIIETTSAQDQAFLDGFNASRSRGYGLAANNCSTAVNEGLTAAGIDGGGWYDSLPGIAGERAKALSSEQNGGGSPTTVRIPSGGSVPGTPAYRRFNPGGQ